MASGVEEYVRSVSDFLPRGMDRFASKTEWKFLYYLARDKKGFLHKDTMRAVYDGSLFEQLEKEGASFKKKGSSFILV